MMDGISMYSGKEMERFYDTREEFSFVSDWGSDCSEGSTSDFGDEKGLPDHLGYGGWVRNLESVYERRNKFLEWLGLDLDQNIDKGDEEECDLFRRDEIYSDRILEDSGTVLRLSSFDKGLSSNLISSSMPNETPESSGNVAVEENYAFTIKNLDNGTEFIVNSVEDGVLSTLYELGSKRSFSFDEFERTIGQSPLVQQLLRKNIKKAGYLINAKKDVKKGWLRKLGAVACIVDRHEDTMNCDDLNSSFETRIHQVRVHSYKKQSKELSSLFVGQEFEAHKGSISTMKFSFDGRYLATAGEDGVVRVWKVIEDVRFDSFNTHQIDPSSLYFSMNQLSKLDPVDAPKDTIGKVKLKRSSSSTCVIFPSKVFRILEKPLHEFWGHGGEVLDLSWSKKGFLLSSSVDKTVRLWQLGCDTCLRVYFHNNYVTCVNFNPLDENHFISGSIDGKVRIWEVLGCQVVDYIDIREIVSAVCYRPDGKGGIVGSMTGNCRFYNIIDNRLELDAQICLNGKRKSPGKRIIGFEFCPSDPNKLMVCLADSPVHIISGVDVICKFKGLRNAGNKMSASFTSDGKHIVAASEENVCVWNYNCKDKASRKKKIWSSESFFSRNATIAIPWCGAKITPLSPTRVCEKELNPDGNREQKVPSSSPDCFSLSRTLFSELVKGSATWPEEKLHDSLTLSPPICKSEFKFLKNACQSMLSSQHMWGLVMVTAGWDGRIRTFLNYGLPIRL